MIVTGPLLLIVLGVVCVVTFALFGVLGIRQMLQPGPALVVDQSGITDRSSATPGGFVPWSEITRSGIWQSNGQKIVTVGVADPEAVLARANPLARIAMRASMRMSGTPVNIATTALPFTAEQTDRGVDGVRACPSCPSRRLDPTPVRSACGRPRQGRHAVPPVETDTDSRSVGSGPLSPWLPG